EPEEEDGTAPAGTTTKAEQVDQAAAAPAELEGLPVRVRQANLAPQLQKATSPEESVADEPAAPSPEAARNTMAAIQLGWQRGRRSATEQDNADELSGGRAEVSATGGDSTPDDSSADDSSAGDPAIGSADDIEPASDGETAGETETTSGEFRTTPSPKQARRRGRRRS
ncbi:MAG: hypothetical protein ACTHKL_03950, partial [Streptosporangiaceae bacterium]